MSILSIATNAALVYILMTWLSGYGVMPETPNGYAHLGLALSTSLTSLLKFGVMALLMRRKLKHFEGGRVFSSFTRITLASVALCVASHFTHQWLSELLGASSLSALLVETIVPIAVGGAVFFAAARLLRVQELSLAVRALTERLGKGAR